MRRATKKKIKYLETETGGWKKKWKGKLPVALIFPNVYQVGMSNLGFQLVYDQINSNPDLVCERIFLPEKEQLPISIESGRPLRDFPIVMISISFEQDYVNLLNILRLSGISPLACDRNKEQVCAGDPLIIGGGVATFINPEPLAPFVDLFFIGESEPVLNDVLEDLQEKVGSANKETLLYEMAVKYRCLYAPRFYNFTYNTDTTVASITVDPGLPEKIEKNVLQGCVCAGHSKVLSSEAEFADIYLTELGRGCSRGCRFCAAGFVYRPPRLWNGEAIIKAIENRPAASRKIGLLGMEMAHKKDLVRIVEYLLDNSCELSFSSLRADRIDETLLELLRKSDIKSVAIAPDGGSERLRRVINKNISEQDVLMAAESLFESGLKNLKLYFMIGLPTETEEDLEELIKLTLKVKDIMLKVGRPKGQLANITMSVNCFVPKPWTPFQYHPSVETELLKEKIQFLRSRLGKVSNIKLMTDQPDRVMLQELLARGDRRVGEALSRIETNKNWQRDFKKQGIYTADYLYRQRLQDELFPWDIIDHKISKKYLWTEYQRAINEKTTPSCDVAVCKRCGVCS